MSIIKTNFVPADGLGKSLLLLWCDVLVLSAHYTIRHCHINFPFFFSYLHKRALSCEVLWSIIKWLKIFDQVIANVCFQGVDSKISSLMYWLALHYGQICPCTFVRQAMFVSMTLTVCFHSVIHNTRRLILEPLL